MSKKILYIAGGGVAVGVLAFAYYAISPLFIHIRVDEALPGQTPPADSSAQVPPATSDESVAAQSPRAPVVDTPAHPASGFVRVVEADDKTFVRYEEYTTINGPDLYVYLAKDLGAKDFVELGRLKATEGNVNYEVPASVDIAEYRYVLTWCKAFGVLFNSADLSSLDLP